MITHKVVTFNGSATDFDNLNLETWQGFEQVLAKKENPAQLEKLVVMSPRGEIICVRWSVVDNVNAVVILQ